MELVSLKQILKSRTMRVALVIELLGVVQLNADFLSTVMTPAQFGWVMLGTGLLMKVMRAMTTTSLVGK